MNLLYCFFWVIPQRLNFVSRRSATPCQFHLHRWCQHSTCLHLPMKMELTGCSEMSAHKIQTAENNPKERIQHSTRWMFKFKFHAIHCVWKYTGLRSEIIIRGQPTSGVQVFNICTSVTFSAFRAWTCFATDKSGYFPPPSVLILTLLIFLIALRKTQFDDHMKVKL